METLGTITIKIYAIHVSDLAEVLGLVSQVTYAIAVVFTPPHYTKKYKVNSIRSAGKCQFQHFPLLSQRLVLGYVYTVQL